MNKDMDFIYKIFEGKRDEQVHNEFVKFGKGEFSDRYLIEVKKQAGKWNIKTSAEFANFLVKRCLEKAPEKINVKGIIICTFDISSDLKFPIKDVKKFMGINKIIIDTEINKRDLLELMDKHQRIFYALSFSTPTFNLKIKPKAPKSTKPSARGEKEAKADFCNLKTSDVEIVRDLLFDVPSFSEVKVKHTIKIDSIELPSGETDPVRIRELSKRKGKIIREIEIDGKKLKKEKEFEA